MKYQAAFMGKITRAEAVAEVEKILFEAGVPESTYCKNSGGVEVLVGDRRVVIPIKGGMTYFEMKLAIAQTEAVARDFARARQHGGQIDIEVAIRERT